MAISTGLPMLIPRMLLGLQTHVKGNALYLSDDDIIYPVGGVLCLHNLAQKRQKFIRFPDKGSNVSIMAISPNRRQVAVAEAGDKISISLYDPWTCKKKKQMYLPQERDMVAKEWVAMTFTNDSKFLVAVTGDPDWTMYVFKCEKGKLDTFCRANNTNNTGTVVQIACNPNDPNLIVLVGQALYRNLACSENTWRQFGFGKAENMNLTCAAWITQDRILAGTDNGKILYLESSELKMIFKASDLPSVCFKTKDDDQTQGSSQNLLDNEMNARGMVEEYEVTRVVAFSKGFLFSYMPGMIHLYEKESAHKYKKKCIFKIPDHNIARGEEEKNENYEDYSDMVFNQINTISVNVSEDRIVATCNETQIYTVRLWANADVSPTTEIMMEEMGLPLHHGAIGALAVCKWKPIFMTTGIWDRTVRIWNYETEALEIMKKYMDDVFCCDLHPTGLFCVVGFSDKIRYMKILIDDLQVTREYPVRACKLCRFSNMGHLFAVANWNVIQIYSSTSFEHMFNLKGHNGLVTGLAWAHDDYKLASCGTEGAVYEWQISTTRRICETIIKICQFSDVAVTADGKSNFGVGSDGILREIINSNISGELSITPTGLDAIALSNSDCMIFATGNNGSVFSITVPFRDGGNFNEFVLHTTACNSLKISYDDKYIISTSTSCICVWRITNAEGRQIKMDKEFAASTEVMIGRSDLVDKLDLIKDLQVRMQELQTEHAYQMRQNEAAHASTIKEIHESYGSAIEELKEKNENLEQEHAQEISNIHLEINKTKAAHEVFIQKLEANYNEKLIVEYDKFMQLEEKMARMRSRYDKELEELIDAKRVSEETITNDFVHQLSQKGVQLEELIEKTNQMVKQHETLTQQIEEDADREIYEMKTQFEKELREEQDLNVRLRGETQASKKKLQLSQKQIDDLNHTVHTHEIEQHKLKTVIFGLEASIGDLRKEIVERDSTIQDKEKRISELKQKNLELEKFKFILEFKIDELKAQIEPRDRTIREQTEQINDMVNELENLQKIILSLELQLTELRQKLKATDNEVKREVVKNRAAKSSLKRIKTEIHNASGFVQEVPKLQKCVRDMFHKYNADKDFEVVHAEDNEAKQEFLRQRDFLERTVKALKKQVVKAQTYTGENLRLVEQNSALITETNNLRRNLKVERFDNKRMNALLGLNKAVTNFAEGQRKLDAAMATREEIHNEYRGRLEKNKECIELLKDENDRLHTKVTEENEEDCDL